MQCELTKYVIAHPIETKDARSIAKTLVEQFILKYGCFKILKSDRGTEFNNELLKEVCNLLNINQKFSAPPIHRFYRTQSSRIKWIFIEICRWLWMGQMDTVLYICLQHNTTC